MNINYLGPKYTYTYLAAQKHFGEKEYYIPLESIDEVFEETNKDENSIGIIPAENSIEGIVNLTFDNLAKHDLTIQDCTEMNIQHYLLSNKLYHPHQIIYIYSHLQALAQCNSWMKANLKTVICTGTNSTARAIDNLYRSAMPTAIIGSEELAKAYDLKILNKIELENNITKFFIIKKASDKKMLTLCKYLAWYSFSLPNESGSLMKALDCFYSKNINLLHIHSRPSRSKNWEYIFYVCAEGWSEALSYAENMLRKSSNNVKMLGSYMKETEDK